MISWSPPPNATQLWLLAMLSLALAITIALHGCGVAADVVSEVTGVGQTMHLDCEHHRWERGTVTGTVAFSFACELDEGSVLEIAKLHERTRHCVCGDIGDDVVCDAHE